MRWKRSSVSGERTRDGARFRSPWERRWTRDVAGRRVDTHLGGDGGRGLRRWGSRGCARRGSRGVTRACISRRNRRGGAPGVRDGLLLRFAHRPVPGELRGRALGAPDSDVSLGAGSRACAAGSGAYPSPSTSSRALWRCVPVCAWCWRAFVRAAASRAWTVCRGVGSRKRKRPTGSTWSAGEHDANLTQHGPKIARLGPRVESIV